MTVPYTKAYVAGFVDEPLETTPVLAAFLNAVEAALIQLCATAPASGNVPIWNSGASRFEPGKIANAQVDAAAAIARSKLDFGAGLVNADIAAAAAIAITKLAISGTPTGSKFLRDDGSWATPSGSGSSATTYRKTTSKTVNNTITETDLLNGEITVAAGVMGATGRVRLVCWGDCLQNTGSNQLSNRWKIKFGGSTILDTAVIPINVQNPWASGAGRTSWRAIIDILNLGAINSQLVVVDLEHMWLPNAGSGVAFATGNGRHAHVGDANSGAELAVGTNTAAIDTSAGQLVEFTVIQPAASANLETKLLGAVAEVF